MTKPPRRPLPGEGFVRREEFERTIAALDRRLATKEGETIVNAIERLTKEVGETVALVKSLQENLAKQWVKIEEQVAQLNEVLSRLAGFEAAINAEADKLDAAQGGGSMGGIEE